MALEDVLSVAPLNEAIMTTRYSQRQQRCEWDLNGSQLEGGAAGFRGMDFDPASEPSVP